LLALPVCKKVARATYILKKESTTAHTSERRRAPGRGDNRRCVEERYDTVVFPVLVVRVRVVVVPDALRREVHVVYPRKTRTKSRQLASVHSPVIDRPIVNLHVASFRAATRINKPPTCESMMGPRYLKRRFCARRLKRAAPGDEVAGAVGISAWGAQDVRGVSGRAVRRGLHSSGASTARDALPPTTCGSDTRLMSNATAAFDTKYPTGARGRSGTRDGGRGERLRALWKVQALPGGSRTRSRLFQVVLGGSISLPAAPRRAPRARC
jgi:hypothetical protein